MNDPPVIYYWNLCTDAHGISRQTQCAMTEFELKSIKAPADPQWQGRPTTAKMTTMVTVQPVGWIGDWHENPKPQWIVPLSDAGSSKPWMAPGSKWALAIFRLAAIRTAVKSMANGDIDPARSEMFRPC